MEFELRRSETLSAALTPDARSVLLSDPQGTLVLRYQDLVAYDASGRELSARIELGAGTISLLVDDRGAAYPLTIDPLIVTEQAHLFASDGAANDQFGISVALSGDTALVGCLRRRGPGRRRLGLRVRAQRHHLDPAAEADRDTPRRSTTSSAPRSRSAATPPWSALPATTIRRRSIGQRRLGLRVRAQRHHLDPAGQAHRLRRGGERRLRRLGGARRRHRRGRGAADDDRRGRRRRLGLRVRAQRHRLEPSRQKLIACDGAADDQFGISVALGGDTAVVGAYGDDDPRRRTDAGSAYVFVRSGTTWSRAAEAHRRRRGGGRPVRLLGGAQRRHGRGRRHQRRRRRRTVPGSAYVFVRSGTTWTQQAKLIAADAAAGDRFGTLGRARGRHGGGRRLQTTAPRPGKTPARPTCSSAAAPPGPSRPSSSPPTRQDRTTSATRWRWRATRPWSAPASTTPPAERRRLGLRLRDFGPEQRSGRGRRLGDGERRLERQRDRCARQRHRSGRGHAYDHC